MRSTKKHVRFQHRIRSARSAGLLSGRRLVAGIAVIVLAAASFSVAGVITVGSIHGSSTAGAAPLCPSDGGTGCTASLPCSTSPCPTVDITPTSGLGDGQYVKVTATNFPSGDSIRLALCSTITSATDPICLNGNWENNSYSPVQAPIDTSDATNTTVVSVPVFFDPGGESNSPIPGRDVTNPVGAQNTGFFCDDTNNPCAIEVTEEVGTGKGVVGPPDSDANTVSIPLSFAADGVGCPSTDAIVSSESSASIEHFLPAAIDSTCGGTNGVVDLNSTADNDAVASDFAQGSTQIAFLDGPGDASEEGALLGQKQYAYIPIAVSGTSVGMLAAEAVGGSVAFPLSNYDLTPNMLAGLTTTDYQSDDGSPTAIAPFTILGADNLVAALTAANPSVPCTNLIGCPSTSKNKADQVAAQEPFNAFDLLNPTSGDILGPKEFGAFNPSVASGSSYQATQWMCTSANTPYAVNVNEIAPTTGTNPVASTITDTNAAPTTLTASVNGNTIFPTCSATSQIPTLSLLNNQYSPSESPQLQAKSMRAFAFNGNSVPDIADFQSIATPPAGFGIMDSSEASFYGLSTASLENAYGNFEAPTISSLEAAEDDLSPCPGGDLNCPPGTYEVNYGTTPTPNSGAYPMPDVTYAVVPTTPQPAATATALTSLLTNLVNYSHSGGSEALPAGYAPLSDSLYQAAMADIGTAIQARPVTPPAATTTPTTIAATTSATTPTTAASTTTTTPSSSAAPSVSASSGDFESSDGDDSDEGVNSSLPLSSPASTPPPGGSGSSGGGGKNTVVGNGPSDVPTGFLLVSLDSEARFLLPALVLFGAVCLVGGPLLLLAPSLRRRRRPGGRR